MTHRTGPPAPPQGRHRSPWGRPGRILPVQWGRVAAFCAAVVVAVGSLLLIRLGAHNTGESAAGREGNGAPMAVTLSPEPVTSPGGEPTPDDVGTMAAGPESAAGSAPGGTQAPVPSTQLGGSGPASPGEIETRPTGPVLRLARVAVDLGELSSSDTVEVSSQGSAPVRFSVGPTPEWLDVAPGGARLDPGETVGLVISLDRAAAPVGVLEADVGVSAVNGTGSATIRVRATVAGPPAIVSVVADPEVIHPVGCPAEGAPTRASVQVVTEDPAGVFSVEVRARLPDGRSTTTPLNLDEGSGERSTWSGELGPARSTGVLAFTVVATDFDGLEAERAGSIMVESCPE